MRRVSSNLTNANFQDSLRMQEYKSSNMQNQMNSQRRIQNLRDDPLAAGRLVRYQSYNSRVNQFEKNAQTLVDQFSVSEGYMDHSLQVMQRVRELAVTGANGLYSKDDMHAVAAEVNELLNELVSSANAVSADGSALFAGTRTQNEAFSPELGPVSGSAVPLITEVRYNGSIAGNSVEVDEGDYMELNRAGNNVFWAEQQNLIGHRDAGAFQVNTKSVISVDGKDIQLNEGDNVYSVISKINNAGIAVKASLDPVTNGLSLQTTDARQLWLEDKSGNALQDLGIIKDSSQRPPYNIASSTDISGGSLFDTVIAFRDALMAGDNYTIGGSVLGKIDSAIGNLTQRITEVGAKYERAQQKIEIAKTNDINSTAMISREGDLNIAEAITDMKMLDYTKQATLSTAAKLYQTTLLNYMR